jgi:hypothetical protein
MDDEVTVMALSFMKGLLSEKKCALIIREWK